MGIRSVLKGVVQAMVIQTPDQELGKGFGPQVKGYWTLEKDCAVADVVSPFLLPELPEPASES